MSLVHAFEEKERQRRDIDFENYTAGNLLWIETKIKIEKKKKKKSFARLTVWAGMLDVFHEIRGTYGWCGTALGLFEIWIGNYKHVMKCRSVLHSIRFIRDEISKEIWYRCTAQSAQRTANTRETVLDTPWKCHAEKLPITIYNIQYTYIRNEWHNISEWADDAIIIRFYNTMPNWIQMPNFDRTSKLCVFSIVFIPRIQPQ